MQIFVAPDKFKGSLTASQVIHAIRSGWLEAMPDAVFSALPIADGGEGTVEAFLQAGAEAIQVPAVDALGRSLDAKIAWLASEKTAIVEMSSAAGLTLLQETERNPLRTTTYGVGLLLLEAVRLGAKKILLGLGGSATNDAGGGMAEALGWRFFNQENVEISGLCPLRFHEVTRILPPEEPFPAEVIGLSDVCSPLLGGEGCSAVFAPQKGASPEDVLHLEQILFQFVKTLGLVSLETETMQYQLGAGAAGGLGFGVLAFTGGKLRPGFETIAEILHLEDFVRKADIVITAEGRMDRQTLQGKGPAGVAQVARKFLKPVIAFCGGLEDERELLVQFDACLPIADKPLSLKECFLRAEELLEAAAKRTARLIQLGKSL